MTLTGNGFRAGMQVRFGGVLAALVSVDPGGTSAVVTTPAHAAGTVDVTAMTPGGTGTLVNGFTYAATQALTSVAPDEGPTTGGQTVTLTGTGFGAGMQVRLGGQLATGLNVVSSTEAAVITPAHAAGVVDVSVSTTGGSASLPGGYTFVLAPTITVVAPGEGPTGPAASSVTLTGTGFRAGMQVRFGGVLAVLVSVNPGGTSATVTTPAHAAGVVGVSVSTPGGTATLANGFAYVAAPTVTAISPTDGPVGGGTLVTLTGTGLTGTTSVTFDGVAATGITVVDATTVTALTPGHPAGAVDVSVTTVGGSGTLEDGFTYVAVPTIASLNPADGPTAAGGTTVTITGAGLAGTTDVTFDGVPATDVLAVDDHTVTATTPAHVAGTVDVSVTTTSGTDTLASAFSYLAAPTLASLSPTTGPAAGGTTVTLTGTGLTGTTDVTFDGVPAADVVVVDDSTVTVTTPAHAAGTVDVDGDDPRRVCDGHGCLRLPLTC